MTDRGNNNSQKKRFGGAIAYFLIFAAVMLLISFLFSGSPSKTTEMDLSQVAAQAKAGQVKSITVQGDTLQVTLTNGNQVTSQKESGVSLTDTLRNYGVGESELAKIDLKVVQPADISGWVSMLIWILPAVGIMAFFFLMMRQTQGAGNQIFSFAKSRARQVTADRPTVTFDDVAGVDEAKMELKEVVEFLKHPQRFQQLGARIPKGLLLVGPPGTGKTLMARAVAGEAGVPFFSISGSEFVEMFVGVGASRVRDLFDQAKRNAPCIVFIDEIDAVGRHRGAGLGGGHDEREQTLNQILVEMDGFDTNTNIIVLAATNRPDILDPALLRPGRFDRRVLLDLPDVTGRLAILRVHARGKPLDSSINLDTVAKETVGFSGADIENLINESAILAARSDKKSIGMSEVEEAVDRVIAGPERRSRVISQREKAITSYHEAGHALVAHLLPHADPVHKISIVARGMTGGHTRPLPGEDRHLATLSQLKDQLALTLAGRVSEQLVFNEITTGAGNDLEVASNLARRMVSEYGMSEELGPVVFGRKEELVFLGREISEQRNYSDETADRIDKEVRRLIDEARDRAIEILTANRSRLERVADALMHKETLQGDELKALLGETSKPDEPVSEQLVYQPGDGIAS